MLALGAAALLLGFILFLTSSVLAQSVETLVSTTGQSRDNSAGFNQAQAFTTGDNPAGYELTSVGIQFHDFDSGTTTVQIMPNSSTNKPDAGDTSKIITLSSPSTFAGNSLNVFTAPAGTTLKPNTTYFVVRTKPDSQSVLLLRTLNTEASAEDSGKASGWSIADQQLRRERNTQEWTEFDYALMMEIKGVALNSASSGRPKISGATRVGETLTAKIGTITDPNSLPASFPDDYTLQWVRVDGGTDTDISGATSGTYELANADLDKRVKVKVSFTDDAGYDEELTSALTETVAPPPFTAEFLALPTSHDGEATFTFRVKFSEEIKQGTKRNLWRALTPTGADMKQVLRVDNRLDLFEFTFEPKGNDDVTITLGPSTTDCTARDAICTDEGTALTGTINATISGPSG